MARLVIFREQRLHRFVELGDRLLKVGRGQQNDIVLDDPDQVVSLLRRLEKAGRRRMAFRLARLGTEAFPDHAALWAEAGAVHASRGRSEAAVRCYARAIALEPELVIADASLAPSPISEEYQERILNDGSRWEVYKRFFTGEGLAAELGGGRVLHEGRWFVVVASP